MGDQGLAERLAAETARNLTILEGLGERILGRLQDDAALSKRSGTKTGALPRDVMRMYREYRTGLRELRMEALLRQKLKMDEADDMPMTDEEYQAALAEMHREGLLKAEREELERELAGRAGGLQVRLPPASAVALDSVAMDVPSVEQRPAPAGASAAAAVSPRASAAPVEQAMRDAGAGEDGEFEAARIARPAQGGGDSDDDDDDDDDDRDEGGWL